MQTFADENYRTCAGFLTRAAADLGARQKLIKPHCTGQNGKVERFNLTFATEWAH